jgi:MFS family permease
MESSTARGKLMFASFLTLVAAGIGFATRAASGSVWGAEYGIDGSQFGAIMGAGFLGFGAMIFFGGVLVEALGYKLLLTIAFLLHLVSALMLFVTDSVFATYPDDPEAATNAVFWVLWSSALLFSICQGLYEAVINPLVAQIYPESKTHYLNILHAGWPAGMIIGGLLSAGFLGSNAWFVSIPWEFVLASFALVVVLYGVLAFPNRFPKAVGQSGGGFAKVFSCFASLPFLLLIILQGMVGYMELGVDSWISKLMENLLPNAVIILVYTSALMFILRFFAGPIVHRINPIGLLLSSSLIAIVGLLWLGSDINSTIVLFAAATFYSLGKAFLWPTMLGVAGERYPQSGAVAMGALGAAGMLTVGLVAGPRIGAQQGNYMSVALKETAPETFERYASEKDTSEWGFTFQALNPTKLGAATSIEVLEDGKLKSVEPIENATAELISPAEKELLIANAPVDVPAVKAANLRGGRKTLRMTALVPGCMAVGYLILLVYFRATGGYKQVEHEIDTEDALRTSAPAPSSDL